MNIAHRLRSVAHLTFGNALSLAYLGLVAAAMAFTLVDTLFVEHADASMSGAWMLFLTVPTIFAFLPLASVWEAGGPSGWLLFVAVTVAALVQATALGLLYRTLRDPGPGHGSPARNP